MPQFWLGNIVLEQELGERTACVNDQGASDRLFQSTRRSLSFLKAGPSSKIAPRNHAFAPKGLQRPHARLVVSLANSLRGRPEDAVQETLLAAIQSQTYAGKSAPRTWLTGILKHKIIDCVRRQIRDH